MCYRGFWVLRGQVRPAEAKTRNLARLWALDGRGIKESDGLGYSLVPVSHQLCDPWQVYCACLSLFPPCRSEPSTWPPVGPCLH